MKHFIREYFTYTKRERNGIFVLLFIIVSLIVYLNISEKFIRSEKVDFAKFEKEIQALNAIPAEKKSEENSKQQSKAREFSTSPERFAFNPDNLSESDWKRLGLSQKQIAAIKNYQAKGGRFRKKEDLKKMYVISSQLYNSLEPYIKIPVEEKSIISIKTGNENKHSEVTLLELNTADSVQLTALKGIGPFFAKSIIKYKNVLGGYYSKEQLLEVWKFDKEKYDAVKKYLTVDSTKIKKINVNTCTAQELKHPYISWKIANGIVSYRSKHGNFTTLEEIKRTDLLSDETFSKMVPYLRLGN